MTSLGQNIVHYQFRLLRYSGSQFQLMELNSGALDELSLKWPASESRQVLFDGQLNSNLPMRPEAEGPHNF